VASKDDVTLWASEPDEIQDYCGYTYFYIDDYSYGFLVWDTLCTYSQKTICEKLI